MSIAEFLNERIDDDEWQAEMSLGNRMPQDADDEIWSEAVARRVLAECKAKRAIVAQWGPHETLDGPNLLTVLATVYAAHPDYRQEWA